MHASTIGRALVAAVIVAVSACSSGGGGGAAAPTTTSTSATTSTITVAELSTRDPCTLLSDGDRGILGIRAGQSTGSGQLSSCHWFGGGGISLSIGVNPDKGFDDLNLQGTTTTQLETGLRHLAYRVDDPEMLPDRCNIIIAITSSSSLDIIGGHNGSPDSTRGCEVATEAAKLLDPKLP